MNEHENEPRQVAHGALRGVIAAMAMTGMRAFTISVGLVDEPPPRAILRQKSRGLFRAAPKRPRRAPCRSWRTGATAQPAGPRSRRCPTGSAGGRGSGPSTGSCCGSPSSWSRLR